MSNKNATLAILVIASLLASPIVAADGMKRDTLSDIPANAQGTGMHDTLVSALSHAGLVGALQGDGPFTVFAPTDQAFTDAGFDLAAFDTDEENATLVDILTYHVVLGAVASDDITDGMTVDAYNGDSLGFTLSSGTVMVNDATVTQSDLMASNGIIHAIDKVLMPPGDVADIPTVASGTGVHDSLVAAVIQAELLATLQGDGPFTVFAPTDDAFAAAGIDLAALDNDEGKATLTDILLYHVYAGSVVAGDITEGMMATMANGDDVTFTLEGGLMVNDANIYPADVTASNGIIHVIDKVLMPPADPVGDICYNMVSHTIVPGADMATCLSYMYVEDYEMNGQSFTGCYNTMTHQLDAVSQEICEGYVWTPAVDIAMTAQATTIHNSLVAAVVQAELLATLQGDGPFTVFAPTDDAFAAAGIDLAALDNDEGKATLTDILLYHVVAGDVPSSAVTDGMSATAVNGDDLSFSVGDGVKVNDANVVLADVPASNGVIHVIDKVLMPPADEPVIPEGCDFVVGIDETGYAFDTPELSIDVGQTVCWIWEDEAMGHNVAQIENEGDTMRMFGGAHSGTAVTTLDYRKTFDEDQTFLYICEPHAAMDMVGKITVGTGIQEVTEDSDDYSDSDNSVPGFTAGIAALAVVGALMIAGRRLN